MSPDQLRDIYERFFALGGPPHSTHRPWQYRRKDTSLRLKGCQLLVDLVTERHARRILDLGSGVTSIVLRELQKEHDSIVVTTDTSEKWLNTTMRELYRDHLNTDDCYMQTEFARTVWEPFDVISVDCDNLDYRVGMVDDLVRWCAPDGIIMLDDWRMRDYAQRMTAALHARGFTVTDHVSTKDEYGQTLATAERLP